MQKHCILLLEVGIAYLHFYHFTSYIISSYGYIPTIHCLPQHSHSNIASVTLQFLPIRLTLKYCFLPDSHSDIASCITHIYTLSSARLTFKQCLLQCLHLYITSHISCIYILAPAILHSGHSFIQLQKNFIETKENFDRKTHNQVKTPIFDILEL